MTVLLYSLSLLSASLAIQIFVWRISLPEYQTRALLGIFGLILMIALCAVAVGWLPPLSLGQAGHITLVQVSSALAYACLYSGVEGSSPSAALVECTAKQGEEGASMDDYRLIINDELLIASRFNAMVHDGLIMQKDGQYFLTSWGTKLARFFELSSNILRLPESG